MTSPRRPAKVLVQRVTGWNDPKLAIRQTRRNVRRRFYRRRYGIGELRSALRRAGVTAGRTVFLQSSWNEFYNFDGSPSAVVDMILDEVGPRGNLVMPATPALPKQDARLDFQKIPSIAGLVTEVFRRHTDVERSIHRTSSVCALGPDARELCAYHHFTETAWDVDSPYFRLRELDSVTVALGLFPFHATPMHCADSILRFELPSFGDLFQSTVTYQWRDLAGDEGTHTYVMRSGKLRPQRIARFFEGYQDFHLSNLHVFGIGTPYLIDRTIELARKGITIYPHMNRMFRRMLDLRATQKPGVL